MQHRQIGAWVAALAALSLSCGSHSDSAGGSPAARFTSAHWTCQRHVEGGSLGRRPTAQFEVWLKDDRALIGATGAGGDRVRVLRVGNTAYSWKEGDQKGLKLDDPTTDERKLFAPSVNYVFGAADCRARGKKQTSGTIDGHRFVSYQCRNDSDGTTRTYYLGSDLQDFPIRARIAYDDRTIVTYDARSPEVPATFSDSLLELPRGIAFEPYPLGK